MEKVYSLNKETFIDFEEMKEIVENSNFKLKELYIGDKVEQKHENFIDGESIIEDITNRVYEEFGDYSDTYCQELEKISNIKELKNVIVKYLNENIRQPTFFSVENIQKISIEEIFK